MSDGPKKTLTSAFQQIRSVRSSNSALENVQASIEVREGVYLFSSSLYL